MTLKEGLQQLRSLRNHIQSCIHDFSNVIILRKDIEALGLAICIIKDMLKEDEKENENYHDFNV